MRSSGTCVSSWEQLSLWNPSLFFALGLLHLDANFFQLFGLLGKLGLAGWKIVDAEHKRYDIGVFLAAKLARLARWHGLANPLGQVANGQSDPVGTEVAARQRRV